MFAATCCCCLFSFLFLQAPTVVLKVKVKKQGVSNRAKSKVKVSVEEEKGSSSRCMFAAQQGRRQAKGQRRMVLHSLNHHDVLRLATTQASRLMAHQDVV